MENVEKQEEWKIRERSNHIFDPFTGKHLAECQVADILYNQIMDNLRKTIHMPFIPNIGT